MKGKTKVFALMVIVLCVSFTLFVAPIIQAIQETLKLMRFMPPNYEGRTVATNLIYQLIKEILAYSLLFITVGYILAIASHLELNITIE